LPVDGIFASSGQKKAAGAGTAAGHGTLGTQILPTLAVLRRGWSGLGVVALASERSGAIAVLDGSARERRSCGNSLAQTVECGIQSLAGICVHSVRNTFPSGFELNLGSRVRNAAR
jgi:hypothetical protein